MPSTNWEYEDKPGVSAGGWEYNEPNYTYNQANDAISGQVVRYNGSGTATSWTLETK